MKIYFILLILISFIPTAISQPTPSSSCLIFNDTTGLCQQCIPGFYLQIFFCLPCAPLCDCTNNSDFCPKCVTRQVNNYIVQPYYNPAQDRCHFCDQILQNCASCSNTYTCNYCYGGWVLNTTTNTCMPNTSCTSNCDVCSTLTQCKICQVGYSLNDTSKQCFNSSVSVANCLQFNSTTSQCIACNVTYYVNNNVCVSCADPNCLVCNSTYCFSCIISYGYINGSCQDTGLSNCVSYALQYSLCAVCQPGYYNVAGSCNQCTGCAYCATSFLCETSCQQGYAPFNYNCIVSSQFKLHITLLLVFMVILFI